MRRQNEAEITAVAFMGVPIGREVRNGGPISLLISLS